MATGIQAEILKILKERGPLTSRQIYDDAPDVEDLYQIQSNLSELRQSGKIVEAGRIGMLKIWAIKGTVALPAFAPAATDVKTPRKARPTSKATSTPARRAFAQPPAEAAETLQIDYDIPGPGMRYGGKKVLFRNTLLAMKPRGSFAIKKECESTTVYALAKELGIAVTSLPEGSGRRFWRVK